MDVLCCAWICKLAALSAARGHCPLRHSNGLYSTQSLWLYVPRSCAVPHDRRVSCTSRHHLWYTMTCLNSVEWAQVLMGRMGPARTDHSSGLFSSGRIHFSRAGKSVFRRFFLFFPREQNFTRISLQLKRRHRLRRFSSPPPPSR